MYLGYASMYAIVTTLQVEQSERLNRFLQHTRHCQECQKGLRHLRQAEVIAKALLPLLGIVAVALFAHHCVVGPLPGGLKLPSVLGCLAVVVTGVLKQCEKLIQQFHYVEFSHADNN